MIHSQLQHFFQEEYVLYHVASYVVTTSVQQTRNITDPEVYLVAAYKEILLYLPKSLWTATVCEVKPVKKSSCVTCFVQFFRTLCVLSMSWTSLLLVAISYTLAMRFQQINMKLEQFSNTRNGEGFWRGIREDYTLLSGVCKGTDDAVSLLTLLCYMQNVIYILLTVTFSFK